jgi:hypothetical protein
MASKVLPIMMEKVYGATAVPFMSHKKQSQDNTLQKLTSSDQALFFTVPQSFHSPFKF